MTDHLFSEYCEEGQLVRDKNLMMDSLKKSLIREVRLSWGGGASPPQKNFFLWLLLDFFFTQVSMPAEMLTNMKVMVMLTME